MQELKKYLEEKLKENQALADFWHKKYLMTDNPKYKEEYRLFQGKEEAHFDILEQLQIIEKRKE